MHAFIYQIVCILFCISSVDNAVIREPIAAACGRCKCIGQPASADCSNRDLKIIPKDLPANVTDLNLANNRIQISSRTPGLCQQYPQVSRLSLAWNGLETLSRIFQGCKHLEHLDLMGNILEFPDPLAFEDLQSLQELSSIEVQELHTGMFKNLKRLETLNLTFYGITIQPGVFTGLLSLKHLTLTMEKVMAFPEKMLSFGDSNVLSSLVVKGSKVKDVPDDLLKELINLKELHLDLPLLLELKLDKDRKPPYLQILEISNVRNLAGDTLFGLKSLKTVKLYGIGNLPKQDLFKMARTVKELEIVRCSLTELPAGLLSNLVALEFLDLSDNGLNKLSPADFLQLTSLKTLVLSNNKIHNLSSGLFDSLKATLMQLFLNGNLLKKLGPATFVDLVLLELIDLRKNTIRDISATSFNNLPRLQILRLSGNYISALDNIAFGSFPMLREIDLADNVFSKFPESLITSKVVNLYFAANSLEHLPGRKLCQMDRLQKLGLEDNPVICDCPVRSLHKCLPQLEINGKCSKPADVEGRNIEKVTECIPTTVSPTIEEDFQNSTSSMFESNLTSTSPAVSLGQTSGLDTSYTFPSQIVTLNTTPSLIIASITAALTMKTSSQIRSTTSKKTSVDHSQTSSSLIWTTMKTSSGTIQENDSFYDDYGLREIVRPLVAAKTSKTLDVPVTSATGPTSTKHADNSSIIKMNPENETNVKSEPKLWLNNDTKSLTPGMLNVPATNDQASIWSQIDEVFSVIVISLTVTMVILTGLWLYRRRSQSGSYHAVTSSIEVPQGNILQMQALEQQNVIPNQKRSNMTIESHTIHVSN